MSTSENRRRAARRREKRAERAKRARATRRLGIPNALAVPSARLGAPSMSDILTDFAQPLMRGLTADDRAHTTKMLTFAAGVWNAVALRQLAMRDLSSVDLDRLAEEATDEVAGILGMHDDETLEMIEALVERKLADFRDETRAFLRVEVTPQIGRRLHVSTISTPPDAPAELR